MNKSFTLIFIFYVFLSSTLPCCNDDDCNVEINPVETGAAHHDSEEINYDTCSRLLSCRSCNAYVTAGFNIFNVYIPFSSTVNYYSSFSSDDIFTRIWKPPKINSAIEKI